MKILAIDLGKFNCVSCLLDTESNTTEGHLEKLPDGSQYEIVTSEEAEQ